MKLSNSYWLAGLDLDVWRDLLGHRSAPLKCILAKRELHADFVGVINNLFQH